METASPTDPALVTKAGRPPQGRLTLSRKRNESIFIGDDIIVTLVEIRGDKVRLGITAPREIPVHRQEVYEAIQADKEKARADRLQAVSAEQSGQASAGGLVNGTRGSEGPSAGADNASTGR